MSHMFELLQDMHRRHTGMFIGKPSIIRLAAYLRGYEHAAQEFGGKKPDSILPDFRDWIHERAGSTQYSWEETILQECKDDADAEDRFWKLLDEFLTLRGTEFGADLSKQAHSLLSVPATTQDTDSIRVDFRRKSGVDKGGESGTACG